MISTIRLSLFLTGVFAGVGQAGVWEIRPAYDIFIPNDRFWENQTEGVEVKAIYWSEQTGLGLAVSGGQTGWNVREHAVVDTGTRTDTISGKADYTSLSVSALLCRGLPEHPNILTTLEAGVWYMANDAAMTLTRRTDLGGGLFDTERFTVDGDDGVVGRISAALEVMLNDKPQPATLFVNLGYQFDLSKGQAAQTGWPRYSNDLSLTALFFQLGFAIPLQ